MLHYATVFPETLQLLKGLQEIDFIKNYFLVGGTSLALQIGHRISVDLDLFSYSNLDVSLIVDQINHLGKIRITNQSPRILHLFINDIKVDFISYSYDFIKPIIYTDNLKLASIEDIAAMKLAAITGRGSKKDFIDLYFILQKYTLPQLFEFYTQKYPDSSDFLVYKSLTYFDDADLEPMPNMLIPTDWQSVKSVIIDKVKTHFP